MRKFWRLLSVIVLTFSVLLSGGCHSSSDSSMDSSGSSVSGADSSSEASSDVAEESEIRIEYSTIPDSLYLSTGEKVVYYIENGQEFDLSGTDKNIASVNTVNSYSNAEINTGSYSSDAEDGHYYALYSKYMNKFITCESHPSGTGLLMTDSFDPETCIWKASESENGVYFENVSGYLQYDAAVCLTCGETGSAFSLVSNKSEDFPGSFGFITNVSGTDYRLDCFSSDEVASYLDDGSVYPHTAFYLYEITDGTIKYTKTQLTGNTAGDTSVTDGEQSYQIHVYDPENMQIIFNEANQTVTASGYELEDNEVHDCGFYTYQCDPSSNEIIFTSVSEGKEKIQIGHFSYNVIFGGVECSYDSQEYSSFFEAVYNAAESVENPRVSNKKITLMNEEILYEGTLPAGVLIDFNGYFNADENALMMTYRVPDEGTENSTQALIYPIIQNDDQYLYLPSFADFSGLQLSLPEGAVISSENSTVSITTSAFDEALDLTAIFGDMSEAGAEFPIRITWETDNFKIIQNVILMKSDNIDSAFFELEEDGVTDMPEWLNTSKSNRPDTAAAVILSADGKINYDGKIKTFHVRGNTNVGDYGTKVGYGFKLKERTALAGDTESKAWVLVANGGAGVRDTSTFATAFGSTLYQRLNSEDGDDYAVQYKPIDVYINGEYRGMYILTDKVNDTRIDINVSTYSAEEEEKKKTVTSSSDPSDPAIAAGIQKYSYDANAVLENDGGFIIEICGILSSDSYGFVSSRNVPVEIKSPETPTREQVQKIAMYYQQFEDAIYAEDTSESSLSDYVDLESLAKVYLVKSFLKDMDFFWGSTYFYIDADDTGFTTKLKSCTAWDFDGCHVIYPGSAEDLFDGSLKEGNSGSGYKWQLLKHREFVQVLTTLNNEKVFENNTMSFIDIVSDMISEDSFIDSYYEQVNNAMSMNRSLWPYCEWENEESYNITDVMKQRINERLTNWKLLIPESGEISGIPE